MRPCVFVFMRFLFLMNKAGQQGNYDDDGDDDDDDDGDGDDDDDDDDNDDDDDHDDHDGSLFIEVLVEGH